MTIKTVCAKIGNGFMTYVAHPIKNAAITVAKKVNAVFQHIIEKAKAFYHFCFDRKNKVVGGLLFGCTIALGVIATAGAIAAMVLKPFTIPVVAAGALIGSGITLIAI